MTALPFLRWFTRYSAAKPQRLLLMGGPRQEKRFRDGRERRHGRLERFRSERFPCENRPSVQPPARRPGCEQGGLYGFFAGLQAPRAKLARKAAERRLSMSWLTTVPDTAGERFRFRRARHATASPRANRDPSSIAPLRSRR